jgi:hypothetical protein
MHADCNLRLAESYMMAYMMLTHAEGVLTCVNTGGRVVCATATIIGIMLASLTTAAFANLLRFTTNEHNALMVNISQNVRLSDVVSDLLQGL